MIHFHSLQVKKIQKETEDCVSISFEVPEELKNTFQFKQGQTLTFRKKINEEELRRNYSICSSPFDNELKVAVKKVEGGIFSTYVNEELEEGDFLDVMPPTGEFYTELNPTQQKTYVAFAAGSGITPILSILKTTLLTEPKSNFTLVYGNRTKASIIFKEELEALKDKFIDRFRIYHILFFLWKVPYLDNYALSQWLGLAGNWWLAEILILMKNQQSIKKYQLKS